MDWLWQGLITNWLSTLLIIGAGAGLALLKTRRPQWVSPVLYGLLGSGSVAIILVAFYGLAAIPKKQRPQTTPENVEANLRVWLDAFGISTRKVTDQDSHFALIVTLNNGTPVAIVRSKKLDRYIVLQSTLTISPEHKTLLDKLSNGQKMQIREELAVEMARAKIGFTIEPSLEPSLSGITLTRRVPITTNLAEDTFMERIDEIDEAVILARNTIVLALERIGVATTGKGTR